MTQMKENLNNSKNQSFFRYMVVHPRLANFFIYSLSSLCFGMMITCLGPMFPYLAVVENRSQVEYSLLFTCRALGFIIGGLSIRLIEDKFSLHHLLAFGIILMGVSSCFFNFGQSMVLKCVVILIGSIGCAYQDVTVNLSALQCFKKDNTAMWLQMIHGFFGIGGLLGPFIVYLFELRSLTIIGIVSVISAIFYFYIPSPQIVHNIQNEVLKQQKRELPKISIYLTCLCFFFIVGQEAGFAGWVSPYAVLQNFSNKQHATMYSSVYWISITASRFVLAAVKGSDVWKLEILALVGVVNSGVSYVLIFMVNSEFGLIFMSVFYGVANSSMYALQLTIPEQFGYTLNIQNAINFVIWASLGDGCLAGGIGKLMGWFSYNWLIYGMFIIDSVILLVNKINKKILIDHKKADMEDKLLHSTLLAVL